MCIQTRTLLSLLALLVFGSPAPVPASPPRYSEEEVERLVELVQAEKEPEARRAKACRELEHSALRTHMPVLRRLLREDRSVDVRLSAALTLVAHGDRKSPRDTLLATAYEGSRTPNCTRSDVLIALGRLGDPAGAMHLERALKGEIPPDEPYFLNDACKALMLLNTPESRKVLLSTLRDAATPEARHAAVTPIATLALGVSPAERAGLAAALVAAARMDPEEKVAEQAGSALFWSGVDGRAFFNLLGADPEPRVRARMVRVLARNYLTPERLKRAETVLLKERHELVKAEWARTLATQRPPSAR